MCDIKNCLNEIKKCKLCDELELRPHNPIPKPGYGNIKSKLLFVGAHPSFVDIMTNKIFANIDDLKKSQCIECTKFELCYASAIWKSKSSSKFPDNCYGFNRTEEHIIQKQKRLKNLFTAGEVLKTIFDDLGVKREDFFFTNIVNCRTYNDRVAKKAEIKNCKAHLDKIIETIKPEFIIAFGNEASKALFDIGFLQESIGALEEYNNIKALTCWGPNFLNHMKKHDEDILIMYWWDIRSIIQFALNELKIKHIHKDRPKEYQNILPNVKEIVKNPPVYYDYKLKLYSLISIINYTGINYESDEIIINKDKINKVLEENKSSFRSEYDVYNDVYALLNRDVDENIKCGF